MPNHDPHERYYKLGRDYWWFYGKYRLVLGLLKPWLPAYPCRIFDAGCGPGHFMELLKQYGTIIGTDYSLERVQFCRTEHLAETAQADLRAVPFRSESFDLITTIDTIEHIKEDQQALKELHRVLKPGGLLAVTVPAFMLLWGSHDENQGHFKRYRVEEMTTMMEAAGFEILKATYAEFLWFFPLLLIRKLKALKDRIKPSQPSDDFFFPPAWLNRLLTLIITAELPLLRTCNLPLGVTMICVGRRKT